ncbi:hypothetical protein [Pelagibius sp. Alg239-R121]|uniref:hypothetical protein n=1 Tax=Pelagibius sp. Alg239-R121 TaxID=2993448 RepID=UPI0024A6FD70|nr:hypothetical protein [Pelagibius sp. Alg239-R121]
MIPRDFPVSEAFPLICPVGPHQLTKTGSLITAIELGGSDPDAQTDQDAVTLSMLSRVIYGALPNNCSVSEYYIHGGSEEIRLRDREDPLSHKVSKAREAALNKRGLARSRLIHVIQMHDPNDWNGYLSTTLIKNLPMFFLSRESRQTVLSRLRRPNALILRERELEARAEALSRAADDAAAKWSLAMSARRLRRDEFWPLLRFFATFNPLFLDPAYKAPAPVDDCDVALASGDIVPVKLNHEDALRLNGAETRYCRIASIHKTPKNPIGLWSKGPDPIIGRPGNFILQNHYTPLSAIQQTFSFKAARTRVDRTRVDLFSLFVGDDFLDTKDERLAIRQKIEQLEQAEALDDTWATQFAQLVLFDESPLKLKQSVINFNNSLEAKGFSLVWEGVGLPMAFQSLQPGGEAKSIRQATVSSSRAAALSLVNRANNGCRLVEDLNG